MKLTFSEITQLSAAEADAYFAAWDAYWAKRAARAALGFKISMGVVILFAVLWLLMVLTQGR